MKKIFTVGLQKILSLLEAEDADVRIHAVKVVANLAAEGFLYCLLTLKNHITVCFFLQVFVMC